MYFLCLFSQPPSLKQLTNLYVGRAHSCWKEPAVITWLEENVAVTCALAESDSDRYGKRISQSHFLGMFLFFRAMCVR